MYMVHFTNGMLMQAFQRVLCAIAILTLTVTGTALGQGLGAEGDAFTYQFFEPGEPSMRVYIWGDVGNAGIWRVSRDVDFVELAVRGAARRQSVRSGPGDGNACRNHGCTGSWRASGAWFTRSRWSDMLGQKALSCRS